LISAFLDRRRRLGENIHMSDPQMTEAEWLAATTPFKGLEFLAEIASDHKFRLFCAAVCREIWDLIKLPEARNLLLVIEDFADGKVPLEDMDAALDRLIAVENSDWYDEAAATVYESAQMWEWNCRDVCLSSAEAAVNAVRGVGIILSRPASAQDVEMARVAEYRKQAAVLRDIFGPLPFREITADSAWLRAPILRMAQGIYDERELPSGYLDSQRLAVLADALEEAGCDNADVLAHCREPGTHVRGCWVIDLLLGKHHDH
jgi:hypothetical protein